jgi:hypothetical protein
MIDLDASPAEQEGQADRSADREQLARSECRGSRADRRYVEDGRV